MAAAAAAAALIADASEHPVHPMDSDGDGVGIDLTGEDFLNQMFGPEPFARKAIDAMRAADAEDLQVSRGEAEQRLIDPVQVFLTGMRSFNMPRVLDVPADESAADAVLDSILQASPTASSPLAAPRRGGASARSRHADEDDWIESAVSAAIVQTPSKPDGAKTAVGFTEVTAKNLKAVESAFGNPEPEKAVRRLEKVVSAQITPDIAPQTPLSEDDAMSFLEEFDGKWRKP